MRIAPLRFSLFTLLLVSAGACNLSNPLEPNDPMEPGRPWSGGSYQASSCPSRPPTAQRCSAPSTSFALAICGDLTANDRIDVGPRSDGASHLVVEGKTRVAAPMHVAGTMLSRRTIVARDTLDVGGDLLGGGDWIVGSASTVAGDASIVGTLDARASLSVGGTLVFGGWKGEGAVTSAGYYRDWVRFDSPMECDRAPRVVHFVNDIQAHPRVDSLARLPREALIELSLPTELTLGCGQYRVRAIQANAALRLHIIGPTVLLVDGDFDVRGDTRIDLDDGATLELVIGGALVVDAPLRLGSDANPVWLAVGGPIRIGAPTQLHGTLIAPTSPVTIDDRFELHGAAIVGPLMTGAPVVLSEGPGLSSSGCVNR